jgi:acyl-coenzyme A synthetase/AMP-(fatty) acid ligase/ankyrin repeat protein
MRPAIRWSDSIHQSDSMLYWDKKIQRQLTTGSAVSYSGESVILYGTLVKLMDLLVPSLRTCIESAIDASDPCGVPVVVAVPEGPLLPIAILAVHLLNKPNDRGQYAVLIPLEPGEGKERLKHMVKDSRPALVLAISGGGDWQRLSEIIEECSCMNENRIDQGLWRSNQPRLFDFVGLVLELLEDAADLSVTTNTPIITWEVGNDVPRISHIVYTSGTTGVPKGCVSSIQALNYYLDAKNRAHGIDAMSVVLLASALSFDPCLSDILATLVHAHATLAIASRQALIQQLATVIVQLEVTHILCTPTLWSLMQQPQHIKTTTRTTLKVVALGGEPIPKRILQQWGNHPVSCLYATYGVTEACVYQTIGQVSQSTEPGKGQCVGKALQGMEFRIVSEGGDENLMPLNQGDIGEVILFGRQLDSYSSYLNKSELTSSRFIHDQSNGICLYKTGDRGYILDGNLYILGRIEGQDGMVKVNGVRVELGEVETALVDEAVEGSPTVIESCMAITRPSDPTDEGSPRTIHAYCVVGSDTSAELGLIWRGEDQRGALVSGGPILTLLRMRCLARIRRGALPSAFVLIPRTPLSPTGKTDRRLLPRLSELECLNGGVNDTLLKDYGESGALVADVIIDCINLQPCQQSLLTTSANFAMVGGDSLAATRVVRTLYANHHGVDNTRFLGGSFGVLEGAFEVTHLLSAKSLGEYVNWLDGNGVCRIKQDESPTLTNVMTPSEYIDPAEQDTENELETEKSFQYGALVEAISLGQKSIAIALLDAGVDPNYGGHTGRLSRVSSRLDRKKLFKSNPLHVSCSRGEPAIVRKLLEKGCKFNSPDASGLFPLHMAASNQSLDEKDDVRRTDCVRLLLDAGAPLSMKDGSKQTVLHSAARAGHTHMLRFLLSRWRAALESGTIRYYDDRHKGGKLDWMDHWYRTPVHWAVLNGNVEALEILLDEGFSPDPPLPPSSISNKGTSVVVESPLQICERLSSDSASSEKWDRIRQLLLHRK